MEEIMGIIAGEGKFPLIVLREAKKSGYSIAVAGIKDIASPELEKEADYFTYINIGEVGKLVEFLKKYNVRKAILAGRVRYFTIYKDLSPDLITAELMKQLIDKKPTTIFKKLSEFLDSCGIKFVDSTFFLSNLLTEEGVLTKTKPSEKTLEDINFGWGIAKKISEMDIGQTIVVKDKAVIAVEAMEGTDETLRRSINLGGDGIVVIKVARPSQDMSFDVPVVGLSTIKILSQVRNPVLCIEAKKTIFLDMEESIKLADKKGISIISRKGNE
ncbi:MAG: LpxI family protein [Candidatus Aminicenantia bacterium]